MKRTLLISACLLGISCRYDGKDNELSQNDLRILKDNFTLIPVCPEQLGGLSTPRLPAEIQEDEKVLRKDGVYVDLAFRKGAEAALMIAGLSDCNIALMKENSPSCGNNYIYDGNFNGSLIPGKGITVNLFEKNAIKVYNENEIEKIIKENTNV
ncbi:MAG: DUF523 domain-containing protein [Candidatus Marinimicrobia bacterium]|nr:DUF523 domain-containing protein [Candidatus Neomarinimicrobiota bacterium]